MLLYFLFYIYSICKLKLKQNYLSIVIWMQNIQSSSYRGPPYGSLMPRLWVGKLVSDPETGPSQKWGGRYPSRWPGVTHGEASGWHVWSHCWGYIQCNVCIHWILFSLCWQTPTIKRIVFALWHRVLSIISCGHVLRKLTYYVHVWEVRHMSCVHV